MVSGGDSFPESSHILQIIQKSVLRFLDCSVISNPYHQTRVLVATIRDQGRCPCVRCLVTTPEIPSLGTTEDRMLRQTQPRLDSKERQQRVKDARDKLYREGYVITGDHVDGVLKDESLVPTQVCPPDKPPLLPLSDLSPELLFPVLVTSWL